MNMHLLMPPDLVIQSDSDDEVVDVSHSQDQVVLSDYLNIMNNSDKVRRWLNFFENNDTDWQVLKALTQLCHNLLIVYQDSMRKYL